MGHLKEMLQKLKNNQVALSIGLVIYVALTTFWVHASPDSVFAFVFFIGSMLILYYIKIPVPAKICFGAAMVLVIIPYIGVGNTYYFDVITQILIYMALALGLNIVLGFSGLFNMGYAAFYAVGAYLWAIFGSSQASHFIHWAHFPLNGNWFWIFLLLGITVTAGVGVLLGLPMMKVRGDYLAVVTLGFGEIVQLIFNNLNQPVNITNGPEGIASISPPSLLWMRLDKPSDYYFIALLMVMLVFIVSRRLEHSRIGRAWAAIREDEVAAKAMGVEVMRAKLLAFAYGAAFAGAMGVIFAAKQTFVDASSFTFLESFTILAMVILGGTGSIPGVMVGATLVVTLQLQVLKSLSDFFNQLRVTGVLNIPTQLDPSMYERFVFGIIIILMMLFRPQGIIPAEQSHITIDEQECPVPPAQDPVADGSLS
jgi:branched-chain amino acid transport system permease protein